MKTEVAPAVVAVRTINIPHHFPKTKPENIKSGIAKPKSKTQITEKRKKVRVKNKKLLSLYSKITSLFDLMNSQLIRSLISTADNKKYSPVEMIIKYTAPRISFGFNDFVFIN